MRRLRRRYGHARAFEKLSAHSYYIKGPLGGYLAYAPGYGPSGQFNPDRKHVGWSVHHGGKVAYFTTLRALREFIRKGIRL